MEKNERVTQKQNTKTEEAAKNCNHIKWHSFTLVESKGVAANSTFVDGLFN
jgi:hypothetical protein